MNYQPAKVKRVTAPLNEAVRAMLCGGDSAQATLPRAATATPVYGTSGSDHGVDSDTLSDMSFLEEEESNGGDCALDCESHAESSSASQDTNLPVSEDHLRQILEGVLLSSTNLEESLFRNVTKALGKAGLSSQTEPHRHEKNHLRRFVMSSLRSAGFNAAVCKTRWQQSNGHPPGDYEFIDVMFEAEAPSSKPSNGHRVVVDIDFRAQFEIARPTAEYGALVEALPTLWVGTVDKLRDVIKIMCDAAKRSLKAKGMHLPPWRKYRYAQAKWLDVYKRTTNPLPLLLNGFSAVDTAFPRQRELHFERAAVRESEEADEEKESIANANYRLQSCAGVVVPRNSRKQPARIPGLTTALALALAAA
ncbi:hypothetical protein SUGI_0335390 [Cryptomeria japonica]|nr:hypothetical protein SUGI_0335390 [Cryptomeria japonica]